MKQVWAVLRREYLQRVRSRWFIFATVGGPLLMLGMILIPAFTASRNDAVKRSVTVIDRTGVLAPRIVERLEGAGWELTTASWSDSAFAELTQKVTDEELGGVLLLDDETLTSGRARFFGRSTPSPIRRLALRQAVVSAALEAQLEDRGVDAAALLGGGDLEVELLTDEAGQVTEREMAVGFVGAFILYMTILLYAVSVLRSTLEEKTNRIVEVVVSAMKPWHLMLGKILGVGAVGLTQLAVWAAAGTLIVSMGIPALLAARPELTNLSQVGQVLPGAADSALFVLLFLSGYFIFSSLYAAVGAMVNSDEEAQQAQLPVVLLIIIPIMFLPMIMEDPGSGFATWFSMVPFFTPILMWPRIAAGVVPWWQLTASFLMMAATVVVVAWVAGRIYKTGILMAGKRPTLPEILRWVREA